MLLPAPITSRANAKVKALRASFTGDARHPGDLLGIEGEHLIAEAIRSGISLQTVFLRQGSEAALDRLALKSITDYEIVVLAADVFVSAVETASPQGIAATLRIPELALAGKPRTTLLLEDLQDPGNLGTLFRSAEAFSASRILLTPNTVNPWNPKVVRASAGSVFRMPGLRAPLNELHALLQGEHATLYAAVAQQQGSISTLDTRIQQPCALMIGNEGAGLTPAALAIAHHRLHIPCGVESLNAAVAGSTLLYEAMRQSLIPSA